MCTTNGMHISKNVAYDEKFFNLKFDAQIFYEEKKCFQIKMIFLSLMMFLPSADIVRLSSIEQKTYFVCSKYLNIKRHFYDSVF